MQANIEIMRIERVPVVQENALSDDIDLALIDPILEHYAGLNGAVIPVLQKIQAVYGYLPKSAIHKAADVLMISASSIFGVATFYSQFSLKPKGKNIIKICAGTACHVKYSKTLIDLVHEKLKTGESNNTTDDGLFTVEIVSCLGACGLAPVMVVNEHVNGMVTSKMCSEIIDEIIRKEKQS